MFEKLVVSTSQGRRGRTAKFLLGTSALYVCALAAAFIVSVLVSDPRLADSSKLLIIVGPVPQATDTSQSRGAVSKRPVQNATRPDPTNVIELDHLLSRRETGPPHIPISDTGLDRFDIGQGQGEGPPGSGIGVPDGTLNVATTLPADPPKPRPAAQPTEAEHKLLRIPSTILQGKAIERRTPIYPPLPKQIHLQGDVSIEVIISPEGRVESARVVSGHPMLAQCAREAALGWRFQPTLLNNVPVRVTGVITFVFKMNE